MKLNRKERAQVSAYWKAIEGRGFSCLLDKERTGLYDDFATITFTSKSGKHRFSVAISRSDASDLVIHLISQGVTKVVVPG